MHQPFAAQLNEAPGKPLAGSKSILPDFGNQQQVVWKANFTSFSQHNGVR
jgi:hypothetical protein